MGRSKKDINEKGLPNREGVYLAKGVWGGNEPTEIDVYSHPIKGLCCFSEDFGSETSGMITYEETDCHVSVQITGLEFISRVRDLG